MARSHISEAPQDPLAWLRGWYASQCDGDWEHDERIQIATLDNPGWRVRIGLAGTALKTKQFECIRVEHDEHDWIQAWVDNGTYTPRADRRAWARPSAGSAALPPRANGA